MLVLNADKGKNEGTRMSKLSRAWAFFIFEGNLLYIRLNVCYFINE